MPSRENQEHYDWTSVDWASILPVLNRYARKRLGQMYWFDQNLEKVLSSEDFVFRAIEKTLSGVRPWREDKYTLVKHLLSVIHSDVGHVAESYENRSRRSVETIEQLLVDEVSQPDLLVQNAQEIERIKTYVESQTDDIDMLNVLTAIIDSGLRSNKELSASLGLTSADVVNTKKRLKRLFNNYITDK